MHEPQDSRQKIEQRRKRGQRILIFAFVLVLIGILLLLPPIRTRIGYRLDDLRTRLTYMVNPPDEAVFVPEEQSTVETIVAETMQAMTPTFTATPLPTLGPESTPEPSLTPTITPTPLPAVVDLRDQVTYVDQHERWNYCGPANLTMALNFWGWTGTRDDVAKAIKPGESDPEKNFIDRGKSDKNVMPYEMVDFVNDKTDFAMLSRYGGDIDVIKRFLAHGYPVLIEKGYYERDYTGKIAWMGHYLFVTGYDEGKGVFIVQDAYLKPGENMEVSYTDFINGWRGFNYLFMLVYPRADEQTVLTLLGDWADPAWANRHALDIANSEIGTQTGIDEFFAWFNKGTSHVQLYEYVDAAFAYDYAFLLYAGIGEPNEAETVETQRPYRIMWYQTGPYWAYYYSGRYQDVINLANTTLYDTIAEPTLEESLYWRALAYLAVGETGNAVEDLKQTIYLNPSFTPGRAKLEELGVSP
ncbi:MAG: C39 family peptidase [Anaerolineales bacterium]